ncbi:SGNH/GDSL hydrolase family protein [Nonomuraea salmonea]|uniref:SGNH/GDSL hydrolase family protein n=1 Tax=Nonomuraea salmonea TaxID=46181 RepID=UPI002FEC18C4
MTTYARYVALGDSQTEGLGDGDDVSGHRGWADRLAEHLARVHPGLRYANLAVRGRAAAQIRDEQLAAALALRPDLVTVMAGMNDIIRPGFDAAAVAGAVEEMFAALTGAGARVVSVTFPDIAKIAPHGPAAASQGARPQRPHPLGRRPSWGRAGGHVRDGVRHGRADVERGPSAREPGRTRPHRRRHGPHAGPGRQR